MSEYIVDEQGKWLIQGSARLLVEPSEVYLQQRVLEEQQRLEQELLDNLIPSKDEMLMAEVEIQTITILQEVGLI
ncbi:hypothetical protein [Paratissierella segnis]|uniref:Uncharacterized protein n=1 Tax=Paratissierella segnis TaxID=2763679 RepID=A0A926EXF5_9FIRM|nr:hypothetical protein [Paratissierella segnis]MBC8589322.1 hypothetical protein [Paratissierella segnis]